MKKAMFAAAIGLAFATISLAGSAYNELVTAVNVSLEDNIPQVQAPASNAVNNNCRRYMSRRKVSGRNSSRKRLWN